MASSDFSAQLMPNDWLPDDVAGPWVNKPRPAADGGLVREDVRQANDDDDFVFFPMPEGAGRIVPRADFREVQQALPPLAPDVQEFLQTLKPSVAERVAAKLHRVAAAFTARALGVIR
jgi:hypothetical protein